MAGKIFINYRHVEHDLGPQLLKAELEKAFGARVFLDVDGIGGGDNYLHTLERQVDASFAMVVLFGKDWVDLKDDGGKRRLDDPRDQVRSEISRALRRNMSIIPVSLDLAPMPKGAQLPDDLVPFALLQAMPLRKASFTKDAKGIAKRLRELLVKRQKRMWANAARRLWQGLRERRWVIGTGVAGAAALAVPAWMFLSLPPTPSEPPVVAQAPAATQSPPPAPTSAVVAQQPEANIKEIERNDDASYKAVRIAKGFDVTVAAHPNGQGKYTILKRVGDKWEIVIPKNDETVIPGTNDPIDLKVESSPICLNLGCPRAWNGSKVNITSSEKGRIDFYGSGGYFSGPGNISVEFGLRVRKE